MKKNLFTVFALALLLFSGCASDDGSGHFFSDEQQRSLIKKDLKAKKKLLRDGDLFDILSSKELNTHEREGLQFLYAYMPVGDLTDYAGEFHLNNLRMAFRAQEEMPWGKDIPECEFNHFVVPSRVNNENLDDFRSTYYDELKARVNGLSLADAALEVNHWCHEHVSYKGSDSRTSAPMATVKTSWGRCGEESTLLVAALRTVGIPARQVYTPRWAHSDDNHAWVEAWVDGAWHFMGACEPEPVLDLGWFNEPASRAMLLHTRVFGNYQGPEEVISRNGSFTEINVTDNYAETVTNTIGVYNVEKTPMVDVPVEFKIYNYAEYCTVVTKRTDSNGQVQLTTGLGTMMAYASNGDRFGYKVFHTGNPNNGEIAVILNHEEGIYDQLLYNIIAPVPNAVIPEVSDEARAENDRRIATEDSLRNDYIARCRLAQEQCQATTDNEALKTLYGKSWGNYQTIADFANYAEGKGNLAKAVLILESLSDKDLRDVSLDVLTDHFDHWTDNSPDIYAPRVSNEQLAPYRASFRTFFSDTEAQSFKQQPELLAQWVNNNITVNNDLNPQRIPMTPVGVLKARVADRHSRDIFFVAMARSLGIAAQINPVNGRVQYRSQGDDENWKNIDFEAAAPVNSAIGYLDIIYNPTEALPDPKYYSNFTIKKWDGQHFNLLAYDAQDPGIDDGMNLSSFANLPLEAGYYILTGGTRLANGNVLACSDFFNIKANDTTHVKLTLLEPHSGMKPLGHIDRKTVFTDQQTGAQRSFDAQQRKAYIVAFIDQGSEPTTHAIQDLITYVAKFNRVDAPFYLLFDNSKEYDKFQLKAFAPLPNNIIYGFADKNTKNSIFKSLGIKGKTLPVFIVATPDHEVYFVSEGYTIGLGNQLLRTLVKL